MQCIIEPRLYNALIGPRKNVKEAFAELTKTIAELDAIRMLESQPVL